MFCGAKSKFSIIASESDGGHVGTAVGVRLGVNVGILVGVNVGVLVEVDVGVEAGWQETTSMVATMKVWIWQKYW